MENQKGLKLIQKIGYGIGDAGSNFCWTFIASFFLIYCTDTLGISAAAIGTVLMFSRVLDGISDVVMGRVIDATHSKMGKARFWYFVSSFPTAIFTFILFNIPGNFSDTTKYVYIFIIYTLISAVFYTMNNIAYSALTALCTKNHKDRVDMGSYRYIFAIVAMLFMSYATSSMVEYFGGSQKGWRAVSIIYSIVCFVFLIIPVFAVKELPEDELQEGAPTEKKEEIGFLKGFVLLVKNKYFLMVLALYLIQFLSSGVTNGMGIYFATYQLGNASLFGTISLASMFPIMVALPFVSKITERFGMRTAAMYGHLIGIIGSLIIVIGGLKASFALVLIGLVVVAFGRTPETGALNAIIAEVDEYSCLKFGERLTGTIFACSSVGIKIGTGLGTALCGFLLEMGGYDGMAAIQTARAITTINWAYLIATAILPIMSFIIFYFMKVEQENVKLRGQK